MTSSAPDRATTKKNVLYGKYQLLERVATGGMAEVFRALSTSISGFEKVVALKRILPHLSTDAEFVSLFIDEAKLTVSLNHSNIVQVFDFGRIENNHYLAMEFVDGRDMTQILVKQSRRQRTVPLDVACFIMREILRGLEYAHTRRDADSAPLSIVHRDVSPHNILVSYDGEVKITDFGIAKARTKVSLTRPGVVLGKFAYMSPEQARGHEVDARSDVYSAAITLYETFTGRRLFYSDNPAKVLEKVRNPKIPLPSKYNPGVPPSLDDVVMKALAVDADARYQSCREFATALQQHLLQLAPDFNDSHLARFMKELFEDEVGSSRFSMAAENPPEKPTERIIQLTPSMVVSEAKSARGVLDDPVLIALREKLEHDPNLWVLSDIGEQLVRLGRPEDAQRTFKAVAAKFGQNGHLVQAVAHYIRLRDSKGGWSPDLALEVEALRHLPGKSHEETQQWLGDVDDDELGQLLGAILAAEGPAGSSTEITSPLFSFLDGAEFANLVSLLELKRVPAGTVIMREGDVGDSVCIVARGRVLIYCRNLHSSRVYLSSLTDGDCFGEFSFFTGEPRAATVETLEEVTYFEISQRHFDTILDRFPNLTTALLQFYKSRVVATLLAKSEVFGILQRAQRDWLIERLSAERWNAGERVLEEGEESKGFYIVKSGEVEVYSDRNGFVFINKLKSGDFFGEIAAITSQARSASVRTLSSCELLRISSKDIQELMASTPEVKEILLAHIARREAETAQRLTAGGLLI